MKKWVYIAVLFLLGHALFYWAFKYASAKRSELVIKLKEYEQEQAPFDVLVLGDSHAERGLDLTKLPNMRSLAYYGENNVMNYYRLKYCLEKNGRRFKYVVLPCDVVTFSRGFNAFRTNKFFYYSLIPFSELDQFEGRPLNAKYEYIKSRIFPYAEWQYGLNIWEQERERKGLRQFSDRTQEEKKRNAWNFIENEMGCAGKRENLYYATALNYLQKMLDLCAGNNIKPIFVKYPLTREVFDEVKNGIGEDCLTDRPGEKLLASKNIPVLNMEKTFQDSAGLFFDCHHMNVKGKAAFTPLFRQKVDSVLKVY